ncbi:MAG: winged helix-turn-helix domain-containing protein [Blastocatellia bacterium]
MLMRLGFTLQLPHPQHLKKADPSDREAFQKNWLK